MKLIVLSSKGIKIWWAADTVWRFTWATEETRNKYQQNYQETSSHEQNIIWFELAKAYTENWPPIIDESFVTEYTKNRVLEPQY